MSSWRSTERPEDFFSESVVSHLVLWVSSCGVLVLFLVGFVLFWFWKTPGFLPSPILQYVGIANQRQNVLMTVRASSVHGMSSKKKFGLHGYCNTATASATRHTVRYVIDLCFGWYWVSDCKWRNHICQSSSSSSCSYSDAGRGCSWGWSWWRNWQSTSSPLFAPMEEVSDPELWHRIRYGSGNSPRTSDSWEATSQPHSHLQQPSSRQSTSPVARLATSPYATS